jgi:hypothetical protein
MAEDEIRKLENIVNEEKQKLHYLETEKTTIENKFETKRQEIKTSTDRALSMPSTGPLIMALLRQSAELESRYRQEKSMVEDQITNLKRTLYTKEGQLQLLKNNKHINSWSSTFK